jgi:hypothetical protein
MTSADMLNCKCLRYWVIPQEEPCWLGEVVLGRVPAAGGGVAATLAGQAAACGTAVWVTPRAGLQSFSLAYSPPPE